MLPIQALPFMSRESYLLCGLLLNGILSAFSILPILASETKVHKLAHGKSEK